MDSHSCQTEMSLGDMYDLEKKVDELRKEVNMLREKLSDLNAKALQAEGLQSNEKMLKFYTGIFSFQKVV